MTVPYSTFQFACVSVYQNVVDENFLIDSLVWGTRDVVSLILGLSRGAAHRAGWLARPDLEQLLLIKFSCSILTYHILSCDGVSSYVPISVSSKEKFSVGCKQA